MKEITCYLWDVYLEDEDNERVARSSGSIKDRASLLGAVTKSRFNLQHSALSQHADALIALIIKVVARNLDPRVDPPTFTLTRL